ncbi:hypothetical protein EEL32_04145 [Brevibacillus laterosporus]|nr:hypothetical protein [Brevibacillus laterosporus]RAP23550.1 hypothetical protein C2W64_03061 [Brevibacillus laterosporus]TPG77094.1 hypothetical protein EEL32_23075 [Brevibacillus laterosporus]TPG88392.1 hypothetical protein EEL32_09565 [Brevibacillus laterosporus]TPG90151.1 hypothetical protein EEL32_04145 [Brevibacillus laterosporus]
MFFVKQTKLVSMLCAMFLLLNAFVFNSSVRAEAEFSNVNNYQAKEIEKTDKYQKLEFENLETGKVETLEWKKTENGDLYISEVEGKRTVIERKDDKVFLNEKQLVDLKDKMQVENQGLNIAPLASSNWIKMGSYESDKSTDLDSITVTAGLLASVLGGPITGIITTMATYIVTKKIKNVYYKVQQYKHKTTKCLARNDMEVYSVSNFTGYIGSESYEFYHCNPDN